LRVPADDWLDIKLGFKTEFRGQPGNVSGLKWVDPPTPVVGWAYSKTRGYESALLVLEDRFQEELMAVSDESLAREGHESVAHFRSYMVRREGRRFRPMKMVTAYRVRPWKPDDERTFADRLLERLFGDFLPSSNG
jgi:hypothetical protein